MPPSSLKTENRNTGGNDPYITGGNEEGLTRLQFILLSTLAAAGATGALLAPDIGKVSSNLDLSVV